MSSSISFQTGPVPFTARNIPSAKGHKASTKYARSADPRYVQILRGVWIDTRSENQILVPSWGDDRWVREWVQLTGVKLLYPSVAGSHITAAQLYGLPCPSRLRDERIHVSSSSWDLRIDRPQIVLHRSKSLTSQEVELFHLRLVTLPQLLIDMASVMDLAELVTLGDAMVEKRQTCGRPWIALTTLQSTILERRGLRFRRKLEQALDLIRTDVDSPRETWLRLWIIDHGFPEPTVHPGVNCANGSIVLHPDLGYPELRIAIEYEGDHHRSSATQFATDIERRQLLEAEGWIVLQVTKRTSMPEFARLLAMHMDRRRAATAR